MSPAAPDRRVASWAVVVWTSADFQPVASGMVNGWRQTSLRAELTAAISALKFCVDQIKPCRLWFDNESVQTTLHHWIIGFLILHGSTNKMQTCGSSFLISFAMPRLFLDSALKVQAHTTRQLQDTLLDDWAVWGIIAADMYAAEARPRLPSSFSPLWEKV